MDRSDNLSDINAENGGRISVYIYGAGIRGRELLTTIENCYSEGISVEGFIDRAAAGLVEDYQIYRLSELQNKSVRIIIAVVGPYIVKEIHHTLRMAGFHDIWWFLGRRYRKGYRDLFLEQCVSCRDWGEDTLIRVEMHAMDGCNLNCVGCTHFSPIFDKRIPDTQSRLDDVRELRKKITHIIQFYILGGEPFLNPELSSYLEIKNIYPHTQLSIATNGLLLLKAPGELLERLRDENIYIIISEYEPTSKCIDKIRQILDRYDLIYSIRSNKGKFNIPLSFEKGEKHCISNGCVNIWNGKIARCPTLMYITEFNRHFNTSFPEEGILSLAESVSGKDLVDFLEKDVPLCSYCGHHEVDWDVCGKNITVDQFVNITGRKT